MRYLIFTLLVIFISCKEKPQPVEIGEMKVYNDETLKMGIKYPSNWETSSEEGLQFAATSQKLGIERLRNYASDGAPIAQLSMLAVKIDSTKPLDKIFNSLREFQQIAYDPDETIQIDGVEGTKISYHFPLNDGEYKGFTILAAKDSTMATIIKFRAFANGFDIYQDKVDEIISSIKLAETPAKRTDTVFVASEEYPFPSEALVTSTGKGYSISIPDNFKGVSAKAAGAEYSQKYEGMRRVDSYIQVDIIDASKQSNLKKIVEQTTGGIQNKKETNLKLSGLDAVLIEYSASANIQRRLYYVVKDKKLYRITVDWYKGEKDQYLPVFEKVINSFKIQ